MPALDEHLRSEDFFEVAKFPTATFRSTKVERGAGKDRLKVTGDLQGVEAKGYAEYLRKEAEKK